MATRVILRMQWQITKVEQAIALLDHEQESSGDKTMNNGTFENDIPARTQLLQTLTSSLKEYYDFVEACGKMRERSVASDVSKVNVRGWLEEHSGAISGQEAEFAYHPCIDLVSVVKVARTPLRTFLERLGAVRQRRVSAFQRRDVELERHLEEGTTHYDDPTIDSFVNIVLCVLGFAIVAAPLWILFASDNRKKLQSGVITIFIGLFLLGVQSILARARPFESLAATAAYSAVLMVFMQMGG